MADTITKIKDTTKITSQAPDKFKVVFYNDDSTPMDFVIAVLMKIFRHSESVAETLTMKIHNEGKAVAGVYAYEIAEQKGMETTNFARQNGYPLVVKVESE
jgi:ATP-dependent Clp protease adaptor protein ClpS